MPMRHFQQNLLIVLALGLCALCAWQWTDQANKRKAIDDRNQIIFDRDAAIQGFTNSMATMDRQVADLQQRITDLKAGTESNDVVLLDQKHQIDRMQSDASVLTNELSQYKTALTNLEAKLTTAYEGIKKQNAAIDQLAAQRDDIIARYTNSVQQFNDLAKKYNSLVEDVKKMQATAQTNSSK